MTLGGLPPISEFPRVKSRKKRACAKEKSVWRQNRAPQLQVDHSEYLEILRKLRKLPKVKRVFIRSGIRFDYLIEDRDQEFFRNWYSTTLAAS